MSTRARCLGCGNRLAPSSKARLCVRCLLSQCLAPADEPVELSGEDISPVLRGTASLLGIQFHYFGDYELMAEIARGGMGVVFRARQISLNRTVALKFIREGVLATPTLVKRFQMEAKTVASLMHHNIVAIYEIGEYQGQNYYSMELVEGPNLGARLGGKALTCREAAQLVSTLAQAVHYAHQRGILHRDLKPNNILLDPNHVPHLADFGLAKALHQESTLTQSQAILGTPAYMAPEQARGNASEITTATDIYGLGAILYETLTGTPPFESETALGTIQQVLEQEPLRPSLKNPVVDRDLETICLKCLEKNPSQRYSSAAAVATDLSRWLQHEPILARRSSSWQRLYKWGQRRPAIAALTFSLLAASIMGALGILWQWRQAVQARQQAETAAEERRLNLYAADISLAYQAWEAGHAEQARDLLEANCPTAGQSDLRGFDWHYLYGLSRPQEECTLQSQLAEVWGSALTADGRWLATGGVDGKVQLWDLEQRRSVVTLTNASAIVYSAAFSPNGKILAAAASQGDNSIYLWDTTTYQLLGTLRGHQKRIYGIAFHPNGQWIAATACDNPYRVDRPGEIYLWDMLTHQKRPLAETPTSLGLPAFSPDGSQLATPQGDGSICIWDPLTGAKFTTFTGHRGLVVCVRYSPDGKTLITGGIDGNVLLWNMVERQFQSVIGTHHGPVNGVAFSSANRQCATASMDHTAKLWDLEKGQELATFKGHAGRIFGVNFTPDGKHLITSSLDGLIKIWQVPNQEDSSIFDRQGGPSATVEFAPKGRWLACRTTIDPPSRVILYDLASREKRSIIPAEVFAFSPDGRSLVCVGNAPGLHFYDLSSPTPRQERTVPTSIHPNRTPAYSPDGKYLLGGADLAPVILWDTTTWQEVHRFQGAGQVIWSYAFSPDNQWLAFSYQNGEARLWQVPTWQQEPLLIAHKEPIHNIKFSGDSRWLVSSGGGTRLLLWDMRNLSAPPRSLRGDAGTIWSFDFSSDGKILAVGSHEGVVKLWHTATAREMVTLRAHRSIVTGLDFASDGHQLATISVDQTLRLFTAPKYIETERVSTSGPAAHKVN